MVIAGVVQDSILGQLLFICHGTGLDNITARQKKYWFRVKFIVTVFCVLESLSYYYEFLNKSLLGHYIRNFGPCLGL